MSHNSCVGFVIIFPFSDISKSGENEFEFIFKICKPIKRNTLRRTA